MNKNNNKNLYSIATIVKYFDISIQIVSNFFRYIFDING